MITVEEIRDMKAHIDGLSAELKALQKQFDGMPDENVATHNQKCASKRRELRNCTSLYVKTRACAIDGGLEL